MLTLHNLSQTDQDDGFHEIQLNGKQLVFLFMAATVVSVVIFLCGVLVGRGVQAERSVVVGAPAALPVAAKPSPASSPDQDAADAGSEAAPAATGEDLTYVNRLESRGRPAEQLKPAAGSAVQNAPEKRSQKPADAAKNSEKPAAAGLVPTPPPTPGPKATSSAAADGRSGEPAGEPAGAGFALQVTALRERSEAEAIAKRLTAKGYSAYVMKPTAADIYRVRVGKFKTRKEAEVVAARLQKEEQFSPWITR